MKHAEKIGKFERTQLAQAWHDWHAQCIENADLAVVLNAPEYLAHNRETLEFQQLLRRALHEFDRRMLGMLHRKNKLQIPRLVTIERARGTGLHANISIKLWRADGRRLWQIDDAAQIIKEIWIKHAKIEPKFVSYGAYAEPVRADFVGYTLKHVGPESWHVGDVDVINSVNDHLLTLQE